MKKKLKKFAHVNYYSYITLIKDKCYKESVVFLGICPECSAKVTKNGHKYKPPTEKDIRRMFEGWKTK